MDRQTITIAAVALALLAAAYLRGGDLWVLGLKAGVSSFWRLLPVLLISFLIAGLMGWKGERIKPVIEKYFNWFSLAFVVLLIGGFLVIKWLH